LALAQTALCATEANGFRAGYSNIAYFRSSMANPLKIAAKLAELVAL
jgi:hypothetical protein